MTIKKAAETIFEIMSRSKSEFDRYGMIRASLDYIGIKEVEKVLKPFSKNEINSIILSLLPLDPMMNYSEIIKTFAEWIDPKSIIPLNAYAIRTFLAKTRRVPEHAYAHLSRHAFGTLTVQPDTVMLETLEKVPLSTLRSHIQTINNEARPIKQILGKTDYNEIPQLYWRMYELAKEPLVIKDGKHYGYPIPHPVLQSFISKKLITIKNPSVWFRSIQETGNAELYQLLVDNGYAPNEHKQAKSKMDNVSKASQTNNESKHDSSSHSSLQNLISYVEKSIYASMQDEALIDREYDDTYLMKPTSGTLFDHELLSSIRKKSPEFRHVDKKLKENLDFVRLCAILSPYAYTHFLKKFKESPHVLTEVIKFSHSTYLFSESSILDYPNIRKTLMKHQYDPSMTSSNIFAISQHYSRKPAEGLNVMPPLYTRELVLDAIRENPLIYYVFERKEFHEKSSTPGLWSDRFWKEMKQTFDEAIQQTYYSLKPEKGFDFYNYVGRKKGIKEFKKRLQSHYKTKSFKEALMKLDDAYLLEQLIVQSELGNDTEIIPLMYLQEKVIPLKAVMSALQSYVKTRTLALLKEYYPNPLNASKDNPYRGGFQYMTSLYGWKTSYACTLLFISEHFDDVMNQTLRVPLHHMNMLEKPAFDVGSLYGG